MDQPAIAKRNRRADAATALEQHIDAMETEHDRKQAERAAFLRQLELAFTDQERERGFERQSAVRPAQSYRQDRSARCKAHLEHLVERCRRCSRFASHAYKAGCSISSLVARKPDPNKAPRSAFRRFDDPEVSRLVTPVPDILLAKRDLMLKLVADTCVWLDLAKDYRDQPVIGALEELIRGGQIELLVPAIVLEEFQRNKDRVLEETQRSLQSHLRLVREAVNRFRDDDGDKAAALKALNEVAHRILTSDEAVNTASIDRIETLLTAAQKIPASDAVKKLVIERAISKNAPYHRDKNSVGDAIIIETYAELSAVNQKGVEFAFVTHNWKDFSEVNGDRRRPHSDLAALFTPPASTFWVSMVDLIKSLDADVLADHDSEFNYSQQSRRLSEILEAEHLLFRQVWYNRHWNLRTEIENGTHHLVAKQDPSQPYRPDVTLESVWKMALAAAKRTEDEVGLENLGPWGDFEWGMLNGKLSALRWVLGEDWDFLDT